MVIDNSIVKHKVKKSQGEERFAAISQVENLLKSYIGCHPMQISLEIFSNDMWKFRNGFLDQRIWYGDVQGCEALRMKEYQHIEGLGNPSIGISEVCDIEGS